MEYTEDTVVPPLTVTVPPHGEGQLGSSAILLGWSPFIILLAACGLLASSFADTLGRLNEGGAYVLFWAGLCLIALPPAVRLLMRQTTRGERIVLSAVLGLGLYIFKILQYPTSVAFYDEFLHLRTAEDIAITHHLFSPNPLLPISALYPGLEIVTNALSGVTGLPIFYSGLMLVGVARILTVLSLFVVVESFTHSARLAGIAVTVYACNPHFLFFDADFAYESLAIAFALFSVVMAQLRAVVPNRLRLPVTLIGALGVCAAAFTHPVTSFLLVGFLLAWTVIHYAIQLRVPAQQRVAGPGPLLGVAVGIVGAWLLVTFHTVDLYFLPVIRTGAKEWAAILAGKALPRTLFGQYGSVEPVWERLSSILSSLLLMLLLAVGIRRVWQSHRTNSFIVTLSLCALVFPATLVLALSSATVEISERTAEFVFFPLSVMASLALAGMWDMRRTRMAILLTPLALLVLFIGGVNQTAPDWERLPGPYLVSADDHSITQESVLAASWAQVHLPANSRFGADRVNGLIMGSYGHEYVVTSLSDHVELAYVYFSPILVPADVQLLRKGRVQYLLVDMRLTTQLPREGVYFDTAEPGAGNHQTALPVTDLTKFDTIQGVDRIFDSGNIRLYDVSSTWQG